MFLTILLVFALATNSLTEGRTIYVNNGLRWGDWKWMDLCPSGTYAGGFNLRVEGKQGPDEDDTGVNGIQLHCVKSTGTYATVRSHDGYWGYWRARHMCSRGRKLVAFQLNVEPSQGSRVDDTAVNDINFKCDDGSVLYGSSGLDWGSWSRWSNTCTTGICGIKTRVESRQHSGDDTALNDVEFYCC